MQERSKPIIGIPIHNDRASLTVSTHDQKRVRWYAKRSDMTPVEMAHYMIDIACEVLDNMLQQCQQKSGEVGVEPSRLDMAVERFRQAIMAAGKESREGKETVAVRESAIRWPRV